VNRVLSLTLILCLGSLVACSSTSTKPAAAPEPVPNSSGATAGVGQGDAGRGLELPGSARKFAGDAALLSQRKVYFDYDSSEIKPEYAAMIREHGQWLSVDRNLHVRLEGNTDERGSAEYNIGLGERRAQAVKRALLLQGAIETQITTVSYGEERPVAEGHTEAEWSQNRRVDLVYSGEH
jgi:peptidoglycan-associated lipoprotein